MTSNENNPLKEVIDSLVENIHNESKLEYGELIAAYLTKYDYLDINDPEKLSLLKDLTLGKQSHLLMKMATQQTEILNPQVKTFERQSNIEFLYEHYGFFKKHIEKIILEYEGFSCSADKSRWIIKTYLKYLQTNRVPKVEEKKYWHPKMLDVGLWMNWLDTFIFIYYGDEIQYVGFKKEIKDIYKALLEEESKELDSKFRKEERLQSFSYDEENKKERIYTYEADEYGTAKIIVNDKNEVFYQFYLKNEDRYAKSSDTLPEWFKKLI